VRLSRVLAVAAPAVLLACSHAVRKPAAATATPLSGRVEAPGMLFEVLYTPADAGQLPRIQRALLGASGRLSRWGTFRRGVSIRVVPDHDALEEAVGRYGYPWLRAWAFTDEIFLQSPATWNVVSDEDFGELVTHELTHVLMYQLMEPPGERTWTSEQPPRWFLEGMASNTSGEGHRRLSRQDIAAWVAAHPGEDLLRPPAELYRTEREAVYGAAHRAFEVLVGSVGDAAIRDLLARVGRGERFDEAFRSCTGRSPAEFEAETIRAGFDPTLVHLGPHGSAGGSP
jgi:hypothetical protein